MLSLLLVTAAAKHVTLLTFDGTPGTTFTFHEMNDPVMGGQSTGDFTIDKTRGVGIFHGEVVDVPKLKAPGFLKASTQAHYFTSDKFPSAVGTTHLILEVRSLTPYKGYKVSLGHNYFPVLKDYKADFFPTEEWSKVAVPFSSFSDNWSSYTGEPITTCEKDKGVCVTDKTLANLEQIAFWAEGVGGKVNLEIRSIAAATMDAPDMLI